MKAKAGQILRNRLGGGEFLIIQKKSKTYFTLTLNHEFEKQFEVIQFDAKRADANPYWKIV